MPRKNPRRNISRIETVSESGNVYSGWEVRIQRRNKRIEKYFADTQFGGKRGALQAAKEFRDELEIKLRPYTVKEQAARPSTRNRSGIVGVRLAKQVDLRGEYEFTYYFWVAQWTDGKGKRKTRSFSCDRYGDEEAFRKAMRARQQGVARAQRFWTKGSNV